MRSQIKALKEKNIFIDSEIVYLGRRKFKKGSKRMLIEDSFESVSLIEYLKLISSNKEVIDYLKNKNNIEEEEDDDVIGSYKNGTNYKENKFFQKYLDALLLEFYYDDYLCNNPIGSKTNQKIGTFYFKILNLQPHLLDFIGNVHILAKFRV